MGVGEVVGEVVREEVLGVEVVEGAVIVVEGVVVVVLVEVVALVVMTVLGVMGGVVVVVFAPQSCKCYGCLSSKVE